MSEPVPIRHASRLVLGLLAALLAACATSAIRLPYVPTAATPPGAAHETDLFEYERRPVSATNRVEESGPELTVRRLVLPSVGVNGQDGNLITLRYFQRMAPGTRAAVMVLPIWGGSPYPSTIVARDLVSAGRAHVMLIEGESMVLDWDAMGAAPTPSAFEAVMRQQVERVRTTVIDLRRLMDWAEGRPEIDVRRIGLIGFSESTLQVAGVVASDPRPAAAVLVMGGAHPHEMLATCYGPPADVRASVMRRFGWSRDQFASVLAPLLQPIDPERLGSRVDPRRVLVIDAHYDDCIPVGARDALWNAFGRPERISVTAGHAGSFLAMTFLGGNHLRTAINRFFARALD